MDSCRPVRPLQAVLGLRGRCTHSNRRLISLLITGLKRCGPRARDIVFRQVLSRPDTQPNDCDAVNPEPSPPQLFQDTAKRMVPRSNSGAVRPRSQCGCCRNIGWRFFHLLAAREILIRGGPEIDILSPLHRVNREAPKSVEISGRRIPLAGIPVFTQTRAADPQLSVSQDARSAGDPRLVCNEYPSDGPSTTR